jgi:tRNA U34 5-methylaminomethyl-2-thiouridine-forming methyltransferase MnmC
MKEAKREIIQTADGSSTVAIPALAVTYHSKHGAVLESMHVFIKAGLHKAIEIFYTDKLRVFEMGFGTGLNALLTLLESEQLKQSIHYTSIELYPLTAQEINELNYEDTLPSSSYFKTLHEVAWNKEQRITPYFSLQKLQEDLLALSINEQFHVIYYDAFAPTAQPHLWTEETFKKLASLLVPGGLLVTYCSKSSVRRAMEAAGFKVEKLQGPPGKREMVRAYKAC